MDAAAELKKIRTARRALEEELQLKSGHVGTLNRRIAEIRDEMRALDERRAALMQKPGVTEHAILRFFERCQGIDRAAVVAEILTPANVKAIETLGDCELPLGNGHRAIVKNKQVVTIE